MKHTSQSEFGRPVTAVLEYECVDKWEVLDTLTLAASALNVTHRTLGVLKALMSFHPGRVISPDIHAAVVFPANKTIATRLNGMPESTLRRHLAILVDRGLVSRHDSANRKRFARHKGQGAMIAFGFDLSPLARHWTTLQDYATQAQRAAQQVAALRVEIAHMRQTLINANGHCTLTELARLTLRRKSSSDDLAILRDDLMAAQMSITDTQNERHIESDFINQSVQKKETLDQIQTNDDILRQTIASCKEYKCFYPDRKNHWNDIVVDAQNLSQMIGIDPNVFAEAVKVMGAKQAATVVIYILERLSVIANPGGYLRRLTQMADAGQFNMHSLVGKWLKTVQLSADNLEYSAKTMV